VWLILRDSSAVTRMATSRNDISGTDVDVALDTRPGIANGETGQNITTMDIADSDVIAEEIERKKRELTPLRYCRFIAENPKMAFGKTLY